MLRPYIDNSQKYPLFTNTHLDLIALLELQSVAYREFYFDTTHIQSLIKKAKSISTIYSQYEHIFEHAFGIGVR